MQHSEILIERISCGLLEARLHIFRVGVLEFPGGEIGMHTPGQFVFSNGLFQDVHPNGSLGIYDQAIVHFGRKIGGGAFDGFT